MKYDASSIQVFDDPVAIIRKRPALYAGTDEVRPEWLASALARDALDLGCKDVEIHRVGSWWVVASEEDWLAYDNKLDVRETFNRFLCPPLPASMGAGQR